MSQTVSIQMGKPKNRLSENIPNRNWSGIQSGSGRMKNAQDLPLRQQYQGPRKRKRIHSRTIIPFNTNHKINFLDPPLGNPLGASWQAMGFFRALRTITGPTFGGGMLGGSIQPNRDSPQLHMVAAACLHFGRLTQKQNCDGEDKPLHRDNLCLEHHGKAVKE